MNLLKHVRRPAASVRQGRWWISCDCGWKGAVPCYVGARVKTGDEVQRELDALFVSHIPPAELRTYLMIDQTQVPVPLEAEGGGEEVRLLARGNYIMPEGVPCMLTSHGVVDGVHYGKYLVLATGETGQLPVGEVRTADGRVFKLDAAA